VGLWTAWYSSEKLRTMGSPEATSENSVKAKFAEFQFSLIHRTAQRD
jgi:hypothetical protein